MSASPNKGVTVSRTTALICMIGLVVLCWAPQASSGTAATKDGEIAVPNVVGLFYIEAFDELQGAGFNPARLIGNLTTAHITDQCPRGGTLAAPGTFVALRIAGTIDCAGAGSGAGGDDGGGDGSGRTPAAVPKLVPLIFIPGIMGSHLVNQVGDSSQEVWPRAVEPFASDTFLQAITLTPQLTDQPGLNIVPGDPISKVLLIHDEYAPLFETLRSAGYHEETDDPADQTLWLFGYDWRRSALDASFDNATQNRLARLVQRVMDQTGRSRVDILAHSQGGLVTISFLKTHPILAQHVRRVVTIATPLLGAAKAIGIAKWARPCEFDAPEVLGLQIGSCGADMKKVRDAVHDMPGVYELFPTPSYATLVGTSPITSPEGAQLSYASWSDILRGPNYPLSPALISEAAGFHDAVTSVFDPAGAPYKVLRIIGNGPKATPISFREVPMQQCRDLRLFCRATTSGRESDTLTGDGTVPAPSASLVRRCTPTGPPCVDRHPASITNSYFKNLSHMGLMQAKGQDSPVCRAVKFFGGACPSPSFAATLDGTPPPDIDGVDIPNEDAPDPAVGIQVDVWGAADVTASDVAGNTAGEIASFLDEQLVSFVDPGTYGVTIRPTDAYPVRVAIKSIGAEVGQQTTFFLPSVRPGETYRLPFTSDGDLRDVQLGGPNGAIAPSGTTDGDTSSDGAPPRTIGGGTLTPAGSSSVQLLARDDGSGVGSTYVTPGDGSAVRFDGPFAVPLYSTVSFASVDRQGNVENPQSIVADDTPGYRDLATPIVANDRRKIVRTIFPQGDQDWFRFDADGTSEYRVQLDDHRDNDFSLELIDANGTVVQSLHRPWRDDDSVRAVLPAGMSFVHVLGIGTAADRWHPYRLKLEAHRRDHGHDGDRCGNSWGGGGLLAPPPLDASGLRELLADELADDGAVGASGDLRHHVGHHPPELTQVRRADLGDHVVHDLLELFLGQLLGHEFLEDRELGLFLVGRLGPVARAKRLGRLDAPLALALQHLELLVLAQLALQILLRRAQRREQKAQRIAARVVPREARLSQFVFHPFDQAHASPLILPPRTCQCRWNTVWPAPGPTLTAIL
jgi:pimeloyl-ACP methyl ester carboxylesterase